MQVLALPDRDVLEVLPAAARNGDGRRSTTSALLHVELASSCARDARHDLVVAGHRWRHVVAEELAGFAPTDVAATTFGIRRRFEIDAVRARASRVVARISGS